MKVPYFEDVKQSHIVLTSDEQDKISKQLASARQTFKETLFKVEAARDIIYRKIKTATSLSGISSEFNSNKAGNNKEVRGRIDSLLIGQGDPVKRYLKCNFREDWLIREILPQLHTKLGLKDFSRLHGLSESILGFENTLVRSTLKVAVQIALKNKGKLPNEEAVQLANLGLVEAVKRFDPSKHNAKFITYAYHKMVFKIKQKNFEDPDSIVRAKDGGGKWLSLEDTLDGGRERKLEEVIPDDAPSPEDILRVSESPEKIKKILLDNLTDVEADVIFCRYLKFGRVLTYKEVSKNLSKSLSKERIRQIEELALQKLRDVEGIEDIL